MKEETINKLDRIKRKIDDHPFLTSFIIGVTTGSIIGIPYLIGYKHGKVDMLNIVDKSTEPIIQRAFDIGGEVTYRTIKEKAPKAFKMMHEEVGTFLTVEYPGATVDYFKGTIKVK